MVVHRGMQGAEVLLELRSRGVQLQRHRQQIGELPVLGMVLQKISVARLEARPTATLCIDCARKVR